MTYRISWLAAGEWVVLTLVGVMLAGSFHFPGDFGSTRFSLAALDPGAGIMGFVFGAVSGLMIAGLQGLVLHAWGRDPRPWIGLNSAAYGLVHALADGVAYRPLVVVAGGIILAVCQYLALRSALARPVRWLPLAAGAWWLAFGISAGGAGYNLIVVGLILGGLTGLGLRLLFVPGARPPAALRTWAELSLAQKARLALLSVVVVILAVAYAIMTGGLLRF